MRVRERERGHSILYSYREFCGLESQSLWLRFTAKQSEYLFNIMPANFGMKGKNSSVQLHAAIPHMVLQRLQWKRNYLAQHVFSKWMRMPFVSLAIALSFALCLPPSPSLFVHPPLFAYNSPGCRSFSLFLYRTRWFFSLVFVTDINNVTHLLAQNRCACPNLFPLNRVRFCFSFSSPNRFLDASIPYRCFHCFLLIWFADICLAKIAFSIREKTTKLFKKKINKIFIESNQLRWLAKENAMSNRRFVVQRLERTMNWCTNPCCLYLYSMLLCTYRCMCDVRAPNIR